MYKWTKNLDSALNFTAFLRLNRKKSAFSNITYSKINVFSAKLLTLASIRILQQLIYRIKYFTILFRIYIILLNTNF